MKKKLLLLLAIIVASTISVEAQRSFDISGTVIEKTTGEAVVGATIKLLTLPDSAFVTGTTTGLQGEFSFKNVKKAEYTMKISYISFVTKCVDLDLNQQKKRNVNIGYITMAADVVQLKGLEVAAHAAKVAVSGDSLVYNAAAYRVPEGSTLEALVKQLPGAKVDKEGNITINGKTVSKILVDGKEFFLNDKEVAMKNIPTEMIDQLKTYDRKSDLSRVTGIDDGEEETVLDLMVKKGMKNGWYGNVNLGAGTQHRYAERFNVNRFNDDFQATLLGSANNVSDMGFGGGGGRWGWGEQGLRSSKEAGVIFTTAYDHYAVQAFRFNSIDYLLKPIDSDELHAALEKVEKMSILHSNLSNTNAIAQLLESVKSHTIRYRERFLIPHRADEFLIIPVSEVSHITIRDGVVRLCTLLGKHHTLNMTLEEVESQLDPNRFMRVNRQFIISASAVQKLSTFFLGKIRIHMIAAPDEEIIVSKDKVAAVKRWLDS